MNSKTGYETNHDLCANTFYPIGDKQQVEKFLLNREHGLVEGFLLNENEQQDKSNLFNNTPLIEPMILYHCGYEKCKPSHSFGPAIRPHYLVHYILSGQGQYEVNGTNYHLKQGDGFLITPGVTTLYCADQRNPWEYCWFGFDGYHVKTILENCGLTDNNLIFTDNSGGSLKGTLLSLISQFIEGQGNEYTYLGQLYLCFSYMKNIGITSNNLLYETHVVKALNYIHNNYSYDIKINDVAKYISIDRTYLYKLFMFYKKTSPQKYLITYRLNMAQKFLKETNLSVTEIAYSCGFKDAPSFNKHFKRLLNITPLQFRSDAKRRL